MLPGVPMTDRVQDHACVFCQIAAGRYPAEIVFESTTTVAFLDRFPSARGHTLVVPRRHAPTLLQLDDGAAGALFGSVVEVIDMLAETLRPAGFNVGWNHGAPAGQHVLHLCVHILPRFLGNGPGVQAVGEGAPEELPEEIARIIRGGRLLRRGDASARPQW
jgi:histidine triad (HIT) family protein